MAPSPLPAPRRPGHGAGYERGHARRDAVPQPPRERSLRAATSPPPVPLLRRLTLPEQLAQLGRRQRRPAERWWPVLLLPARRAPPRQQPKMAATAVPRPPRLAELCATQAR